MPQQIFFWNIYLNEVNRAYTISQENDQPLQELIENIEVSSVSDLFFVSTNHFKILVFDAGSQRNREILKFDYSKVTVPASKLDVWELRIENNCILFCDNKQYKLI